MTEKTETTGTEDKVKAPKTRARKAAARLAKTAKAPATKTKRVAKAPKAAKANGTHKNGSNGSTPFFAMPDFGRVSEEVRERLTDTAERMRDAFGSFQVNVPGFTALRGAAGEAAEAVREAAGLAGKNLRDVNLQLVEYAQGDINRFFEMTKALVQAKTLREALEIQGEFVRTQFETQMKQLRSLSQMTVDGARDSFEPISETVATAVDKLRKAA